MSEILQAALPALTALAGLAAGLLAPFVTVYVDQRRASRHEQRGTCDQILGLFGGVNVVDSLTDPHSSTRRLLLLAAVRLSDTKARQACHQLVSLAARRESTENEVLDAWTAMVEEVARVYRSM